MSVYLVIFSSLLENVPFDWFLLCMYNNAFKKLLKADTNLQSFYFYGKPQKKNEFAAFVQFVRVIPL